jgi:hypothetical protein
MHTYGPLIPEPICVDPYDQQENHSLRSLCDLRVKKPDVVGAE